MMNTSLKYPTTLHLTFSPEMHRDDKQHTSNERFVGVPVVISEKLDGSSCCLYGNNVYARSHSVQATTEDFDVVKAWWAQKQWSVGDAYVIYGENVYGKHSIEYTKLSAYFYVFNVLREARFLSFDSMLKFCGAHSMPIAPILFHGTFASSKELQAWMDDKINQPSLYGDQLEGFVVRRAEAFLFEDFDLNVGKYVRRGHVQEKDKHWSVNITPNQLKERSKHDKSG